MQVLSKLNFKNNQDLNSFKNGKTMHPENLHQLMTMNQTTNSKSMCSNFEPRS